MPMTRNPNAPKRPRISAKETRDYTARQSSARPPKTFSISVEADELLSKLAETWDMSRSEAICQMVIYHAIENEFITAPEKGEGQK